ncbi:hypothetical protein HHI36_013621 [Cryptolaemus montrouzieri]|uniref:Biogenesis of lysosome-related organelles complex 1 subunit 3 n=1 Tax=Cryptolaemus montrouzieri TaxID=559131 RepID=A0ABD2NHU9_9CUCU
MNKPVIVTGEASETDSEDDEPTYAMSRNSTNQVKGQAISGEDSESENDDGGISSASIASAISVSENLDIEQCRTDSLLHQKLREANSTFHTDLEAIIKNTVVDAEKTLNEVDKHILKSQLILQGASSSLKNFNLQANVLKNKLENLLSSNFLSNVI